MTSSRRDKFIKLPFDGLLKIWKDCWINNPSQRDKLDKFDIQVSQHGLSHVDGKSFVQLTAGELNYIKNLYETII